MWSVVNLLSGIMLSAVSDEAFQTVKHERQTLLQKELDMMLGSDIVLSDNELKANEIIMNLKHDELDRAFYRREQFILSKHFFEYKDVIKKTELFKLIQQMPKGAVLHAHDTSLIDADYVLELTYWQDLYACFVEDNLYFRFANYTPQIECATKWQLLKDARYASGDVNKFDSDLRKYFTLVIDNPEEVYTDINAVWRKFHQMLATIGSLISYKPAWERYFYDALKEYRADNVMYFEIRSILPPLYDLQGNAYDSVATAESYKEVVDRFVHDYPDFFGVKLIYAPPRRPDINIIKKYIENALEIKKRMPDFLAGFDLVDQEDLGPPNKKFLPELVQAGKELDFFFHAGETNWNGMKTDENLFDAIVLGTKRIGHGYALIKHPLLLEEVRKRNIALEVNVISNNVLELVDDIRNHPLAFYLAQNLSVVISSDDRSAWEAEPMSHDFYVTFVGVANRHADLRLLKKLALNSLYYSTYSDKEKLVREFEDRWKRFVDGVVEDSW